MRSKMIWMLVFVTNLYTSTYAQQLKMVSGSALQGGLTASAVQEDLPTYAKQEDPIASAPNTGPVSALQLPAQRIPMQKLPRLELDFNNDWKFHLGDIKGAEAVDFKDQQWRIVTLPHDWSIEGNFSAKHPAGNDGGALPGGTGWYRKTFHLSQELKNQHIYIDFGGIYRNSEVWINGHYLGIRPNGYISFRYDMTGLVNFGKKQNVITVKVDNSMQPNSRWYSGSGIYRNVRLVTTGDIALDHWGTFVTTPAVTTEQATIRQVALLKNIPWKQSRTVKNPDTDIKKTKQVAIELTLYDRAGKQVGTVQTKQLLRDSLTQIDQSFNLAQPRLWSPADPYLYTLVTRIYEGKILRDEYRTTTGIRYFSFNSKKGFSLNGKPMKIQGVCMHHDLGALGAAVNRRAMQRQLEILKEMGCNAIRFSHNPPAAELLSLCDQMGFLVMDEAFDMWKKKKNKYDYSLDFEKWHRKDLEDMVKRDRNHPSVILWSIGNEIREQFDTTGTRMTRELTAIVKALDQSRPVISALTETDSSKNFIAKANTLDVMGFNYKFEDYDKLPVNFPGQNFIASETTSALQSRGVYQSSDTLRFWPASGKQKYVVNGNADWTTSAYDNTAAYWGTSHERAWKEVKKRDFMSGLFVWTGFDYLGEPVPYPYPARSSYFGIVDLAGFPKDVYYMYQSEWTDKPVLHVFPHWNWKAGEMVDVWAYYSQADEVELFLNGKSLGIRKKENDLHVSWKVKFEPGMLKAVSRKGGKEVLSSEIHTAGEAFKIVLEADRSQLKADRKDLSYVTVKITDKSGNMVPDADQLISFSVEGQGTMAGLDNGYQANLSSFKASEIKVFKGKCMLILKSAEKPGYIYVRAKVEGLGEAVYRISCR
jgi:beta-galactosidase